MKIIICGKGGSGKSTVSALLSKTLANRSYRVLLIDADESNLGLHRLVGIDPPQVMMDRLGGKKGFKEKTQGAFPGGKTDLFGRNLSFDDLAEHCRAGSDGVSLMSIGKIHEPGEGCACPMGSLSRMVLSRLVPGEKDLVIIDTAAGVEHFGRGIDSHSDLVIGVVDPSFESFALAEKMEAMAGKAGLPVMFILNKMTGSIKSRIGEKIRQDLIAAELDELEEIFTAGLEGRAIGVLPESMERAADRILRMKHEKKGGQ